MTNAAPLDALILTVRGQKVLLDADLAEIYGVPTKALNQAVKRNADRFPEDFRFQLTAGEKAEVVTNCDHLSGVWTFSGSASRMSGGGPERGGGQML